MKSRPSHLVFYAANLPENISEYDLILDQHTKSVASLRNYNASIPVCLAVCGRRLRRRDRDRLERLGVKTRYLGRYTKRLQQSLPAHWRDAFAQLPTWQKWLGLEDILSLQFDRVLYLDNDTFFLDNVENLFQRFYAADLYAREEPGTKRSHLGYDQTYIDESVVCNLFRSEKLRSLIPFNIGVMLMKRPVVEWFSQNLDVFFSYLIRFTTSLAQNRRAISDEPFVIAARQSNFRDGNTGLKPLVYPSRNQWILDQFALWFTLAASPFKVGLLPRASVLQGAEFLTIGKRLLPSLVHYYSANFDYFCEWLGGFESHLRQTRARSVRAPE